MMPWMVIYDNANYGRWLPLFWADMSNISTEHSDLISTIFSQSMTGNPYSNIPPDLWIECTMNKGSKLKSGWKRLLKNEKALLVHVKNCNKVNAVRNYITNLISERKPKTYHKENTSSRLRQDEQGVQDLQAVINEWHCNPFSGETTLKSLQSGQVAKPELIKDFQTAYSDGENAVKEYLNERVFSNTKSNF